MHSLLRGLAPLDTLSLDTVSHLTLGDELGRERSVRVWDEYGAWEMPDMWRFLAKVRAMVSWRMYLRLRLVRLRTDPIRCRPSRVAAAQRLPTPECRLLTHTSLCRRSLLSASRNTAFRTLLAWR